MKKIISLIMIVALMIAAVVGAFSVSAVGTSTWDTALANTTLPDPANSILPATLDGNGGITFTRTAAAGVKDTFSNVTVPINVTPSAGQDFIYATFTTGSTGGILTPWIEVPNSVGKSSNFNSYNTTYYKVNGDGSLTQLVNGTDFTAGTPYWSGFTTEANTSYLMGMTIDEASQAINGAAAGDTDIIKADLEQGIANVTFDLYTGAEQTTTVGASLTLTGFGYMAQPVIDTPTVAPTDAATVAPTDAATVAPTDTASVDPSAPLKVVSDLENVKDGTDMTAALNTDKPWDASAFASVFGANNPAFMDIDSTNPLSGSKSLSIGLTKLIDSYYACYWAPVITNGDFQMKDLTSTPNQIKARVKNTSATAASPFFAPLVEVKTMAGGAAFALLSGTETQSFIELYDMDGNKVEPAGYAACYPGSKVLAGVSLPAGFDGYIVCNFSQGSVYYKSVDDAASLNLLGNASMKIGDTVPYANFVQADADKVADVAFTMSATSESQLNNPILVDDIGLYVGAAMDGVTPTVAPTDAATVAPTATENPNSTTADAGLFGIIATAAVSGFAIYRKRK